MAFIRNLLDSFILILIGYSIFELLDRIISTIIMKFPSSYNLFDFCWLAFSSAYYLIIKTEFNYYFLLAFISVIIIDLVEILISKNLGEALSREWRRSSRIPAKARRSRRPLSATCPCWTCARSGRTPHADAWPGAAKGRPQYPDPFSKHQAITSGA